MLEMLGSNTSSENKNNDYEVDNVAADGIAAIAWSSNDLLALASWDNSVRILQVQTSGSANISQIQAHPKVQYTHDGPALCCNFSNDGTKIFSGGADHKVKMKNLQNGQESVVGQHDAPVIGVFYVQEMGLVISGSWDKTVRFWNGQNPQPVATLNTRDTVYCMDIKYPVMVVGCANQLIDVWDLSIIEKSTAPVQQCESKLKMQTRCVSCFHDGKGYVVGSIEGRVSIVNFDEALKHKDFRFKGHRTDAEAFSVHAISFHPILGCFSTAGSDGMFHFWDKDQRMRCRKFNAMPHPITAAKFSAKGDMFAYAMCYDWSQGHEGNLSSIPIKLYIHRVDKSDVTPP